MPIKIEAIDIEDDLRKIANELYSTYEKSGHSDLLYEDLAADANFAAECVRCL